MHEEIHFGLWLFYRIYFLNEGKWNSRFRIIGLTLLSFSDSAVMDVAVMDMVSANFGEMQALHHLVSALIQCGQVDKARKVMEVSIPRLIRTFLIWHAKTLCGTETVKLEIIFFPLTIKWCVDRWKIVKLNVLNCDIIASVFKTPGIRALMDLLDQICQLFIQSGKVSFQLTLSVNSSFYV